MSSNQVGSGHQINWTNTFTATVTAGSMILISAGRLGFVPEDIAASATGPIEVEGEFTVTKSAATAGALGAIPKTQSVGTRVPTLSLVTSTATTTVVNVWLTAATTTAVTTCKAKFF
jgi:predicted RecA/RadA family phage recombinase